MHIHILQHVPFEGLGSIDAWLHQRNAFVTYTRFFEKNDLPPLDEFDFIIVLGGPMSVNDEDRLPWLCDEKRFLLNAIQAGKGVLGICLGAQLIANALGASVYPNQQKEIGWFPVEAKVNTADTFNFPESMNVFHWHGETFDLPANAIRLASSEACRNQAFQIGKRVLGLQFHLETTQESVEAILANCPRELVARRFVQTETQLRSVPANAYHDINALMNAVLTYLTRDEDV